MNDPFLDIDRVVDRLYDEYKRYGDIIIAFDFDYTVHNFRDEDYTYERVSEMLRKWQPYAKLVVFSASQEERYPYIADYLNQNDIPFDAINEDVLIEKRKPTRKLYYNILLDDRAGLGSAYEALDMLYNRLEAKGELKTWRA